jgi:uncharacterized repeat protein (TIGR01451 family)
VKVKKTVIIVVLLTCISVPVQSARAAGTTSGTIINNTASITYDLGGGSLTATASASFVVDNKVNPTVVKNGDAEVEPGATDQALVFVLRNDGNTPQRYALAAIPDGGGPVMDNVRIYLDNGATPGSLDVTDTLYVDAATFGEVVVDGSLALLIVADTPPSATAGQTASYSLVATTVDATTTTVTVQTAGANTAGVDVVFADLDGTVDGDLIRDGKHSAVGTFTIAGGLVLAIVKSAVITADPKHNTTNPVALPGATVVYSLAVSVTGSGTAAHVVITDPIPLNSTYKSGSLMLNGAALTDSAEDDAGNVGGAPVTMTVSLGDLTSASALQTISFAVVVDEYEP